MKDTIKVTMINVLRVLASVCVSPFVLGCLIVLDHVLAFWFRLDCGKTLALIFAGDHDEHRNCADSSDNFFMKKRAR